MPTISARRSRARGRHSRLPTPLGGDVERHELLARSLGHGYNLTLLGKNPDSWQKLARGAVKAVELRSAAASRTFWRIRSRG